MSVASSPEVTHIITEMSSTVARSPCVRILTRVSSLPLPLPPSLLSLSFSCHPRKALSKVFQRERRHCAAIDSPRYTTYQITQNSITRQRGGRCRVPSCRPKGRHHFEVERDLLLRRFYLVLQLCTPALRVVLAAPRRVPLRTTSTSCTRCRP